MEYLTEIKVRGYHADFYGHVNNARYLEFLEEDRWAWLEAKADLLQWAAKGFTFVIVNININYRKVVAVGTTILVTTKVEQVTTRSMILKQEVLIKGSMEVAADALVTYVVLGKDGKAMEMEGELLAELSRLGGISK
jgi:thioesterase III